RLVVVLLRSRPMNFAACHINASEAVSVDGSLQQLHGRIQPVLLYDEQMDSRLVARLDERVSTSQRDCHRLFHYHVLPCVRCLDALLRMQARWRCDRNDVRLGILQHLLVRREMRNLPLRPRLPGASRIGVADGSELQPIDLFDRVEMVLADASASHERYPKRLLRTHLGNSPQLTAIQLVTGSTD